MGGGSTTSTRESKSPNHVEKSTAPTTAYKNRKRAVNRSSSGGQDDDHEPKKPKRAGRPSGLSNHICTDCTIWTLTGCHSTLSEHHQSAKMRHPGSNSREMSAHASYGGITIALNPDSCICQNCFRDYYRNPTKPYRYRIYEEMVTESGELDLGAELEIEQGSIEGANGTEQSVTMDTSADDDNTGTDTINSIIDHVLSKLTEDGCIYSKDITVMLSAPSAKTLQLFYKEVDKATQNKGYKNYSKLGRVIYDPLKFSEHAIKYTYKLHVNKWEQQKQNSNTVSEERIRKLIMKQCSKWTCASTYDY